jgi:hypothetical protein
MAAAHRALASRPRKGREPLARRIDYLFDGPHLHCQRHYEPARAAGAMINDHPIKAGTDMDRMS